MLVLDVIIAVMPVRAFMQIKVVVDNVIVT